MYGLQKVIYVVVWGVQAGVFSAALAAETYYGMQTHCIFTEHSSVLEVHTMKKAGIRLLFCILAGLVFVSCLAGSAAAADSQVSDNGIGYIQVNCNVEGALVKLCWLSCDVFRTAYIQDGSCTFVVPCSPRPGLNVLPKLMAVFVEMEGYAPAMSLVVVPENNMTSTVSVDLVPAV